jgi:hypothetical protein
MKKTKTIGIFKATDSLKVLSYLAENAGKEFLGSQIQKAASISRAGYCSWRTRNSPIGSGLVIGE